MECQRPPLQETGVGVFISHEKIDVALITETHCMSRYSFISTKEYNVTHSFHPSGKAQGGAAIFVKKSLSYTSDIIYCTPHIQCCAIRMPVENKIMNFSSVYCSPSTKMDSNDLDLLFQHLSGTWLIGGDFNAKHSIWLSRITTTRGRELAKVLTQRNYETISNNEPTYWPADLKKIPDVIDFFVFNHLHRHQCQVQTIADLNSDHVFVSLSHTLRPLQSFCPQALTTI